VPLDNPAELLQRLIRIDTTTPPGNEGAAVGVVRDLLDDAGIAHRTVERTPGRPNLIARLPGRGQAPPFLMQAHIDVVPASPHGWRHPPFGGHLDEHGFVWGRGALDMKSGLVMMLAALLRLHARGERPAGDVLFAVLSDEEGGGEDGAAFLVADHPELFDGVCYAIGEFGGFTLTMAGHRFAPIQVAEKQICWLRLTIHGSGGHGSLALADGVSARLGRILQRLAKPVLPVHLTPVVAGMLDRIQAVLPAPVRPAVRLLRNPRTADRLLRVAGEQGRILAPMLRNTATPNLIRSGDKINVQPASATIELDGRVLPGFTADDLVAELRQLLAGELGPDAELEVVRFEPVPAQADLGLYDTLAGVLGDHLPGADPIPMLLPASTDGRHFAKLGIQTYGFTPMDLPADLHFTTLIHGVNERIPAASVDLGARCIETLLTRLP